MSCVWFVFVLSCSAYVLYGLVTFVVGMVCACAFVGFVSVCVWFEYVGLTFWLCVLYCCV